MGAALLSEIPGEESARKLVRQGIRAQREPFDRSVLLRWFRIHAPWIDPLAADGLLEAGTVNEPGRRHYPEPEDLVYRRADGTYQRYDPVRHGSWSKLGRPSQPARVLHILPAA